MSWSRTDTNRRDTGFHSPTIAPFSYILRLTMPIYINLLSNFRISFDLKDNKPAISALSNDSAEVEDTEQGRDGKRTDVRRISKSSSNATLVGEDSAIEYPQWLAGVGDIVAFGSSSARWTNPGREMPRLCNTSFCADDLTVRRASKLLGTQNFQKKGTHTRTALQRHCDFWDHDGDGLIYPWDIYRGFRRLGFHFSLCLWAAVTMAICASYNTHTSYIPHPLFAINLNNINSNRHGSSTGTYDMDGELDERRFEAIFQKYAGGKDYLTLWSTYNVWRNQRCGLDFFGWFAGGLECK